MHMLPHTAGDVPGDVREPDTARAPDLLLLRGITWIRISPWLFLAEMACAEHWWGWCTGAGMWQCSEVVVGLAAKEGREDFLW